MSHTKKNYVEQIEKDIESVHVHFDKILPRVIFLTFWVIFLPFGVIFLALVSF